MSVPPKRKSWAGPAAEGALVLAVVGLLFVVWALALLVLGLRTVLRRDPGVERV